MQRYLFILLAASMFLSLTAFECASTEMTTAKVALQSRDYAKATDALQKEVAARPQNGEAWNLLGRIYYDQKNYVPMAEALRHAMSATQPAISPADHENAAIMIYSGWNAKYNAAYRAYNAKNYDLAIAQLDTAEMLRPGYPENTYFRATTLAAMQRDADAKQAYKAYIEAIDPIVQRGVKAGLTLGAAPPAVERSLGAPTSREMSDTTGGFFYYQPQNLYVYFAPNDNGALQTEGWQYFAANDSTPADIREVPLTLRSAPYVTLGLGAFERGRSSNDRASYDQALEYLQKVQQFDPTSDVGQVISNIYIATNRTEEASNLLEKQIAANPKQPQLYIQYGNLLFNMNQYRRAAEQFSRVLDLGLPSDDESRDVALFNLGAVYKNWGAHLQDSLRSAVGSRPSEAQRTVYLDPLRKSAEYFDQVHAAHPDDIKVLMELGNLYDVLGNTQKLKQTITQLEGLQSAHAEDASYWRGLSMLYDKVGDTSKAAVADQKATALGG